MQTRHKNRLIFEYSQPERCAKAQMVEKKHKTIIPENQLRTSKPLLPEASELDVVRHYTRLSQLNFSIDTEFYPLGSCTMKYNPRGVHKLASLPGFLNRHPYASSSASQAYLACAYDLQEC